jgi:hypothetical protein
VPYARHDPLLVCRIFGALDAFLRNASRKLLTPAFPRTVMGSDDELFGKGISATVDPSARPICIAKARAISGGSAFPIWRATWSRGRTNSSGTTATEPTLEV